MKQILAISLGILLTQALNYQAVDSYFSQDDFFHLRMVMDKNLSDVPSFFVTKFDGQTFYRPLSRETYNLLMYKAFGLNPLPFHIINLILILLISFLIYIFVRKLMNQKETALFSAFIFLISSVHNVELYYLASVQTLLASLLLLLCIIFYFYKKIFLSLLFFLMALFSHESTIILPLILFFLEMLVMKRNFKRILPFFLLVIFYAFFHNFSSNLPGQNVYSPVLNPKTIINSMGWYIGWSFGLPEILVDFIGPKFSLNPNFIKWYPDYIKLVLPLLLVIFSAVFISLYLSWRNLNKRLLTFLVFSYIISIAPFLFFPQHKFIYYLEFSSVWFAIIIGIIFSIFWRSNYLHKTFLLVILLSMLIIFKQTDDLNSVTYWAAKRSNAAKNILENMIGGYPTVSPGTAFYFTDDPLYPNISKEWGGSSKQAFYILSGSDALQLLYHDQSVKTYFEDLSNLPMDINQSKVIAITARFPF